MVTQKEIDRINELYHKSKTPEGLTPEEEKERAFLRKKYVDSFKESLVANLEHTSILYPDGTKKKVQRSGKPTKKK